MCVTVHPVRNTGEQPVACHARPQPHLDDASPAAVLSWMGKAIRTLPRLTGVHDDLLLPHHLVIRNQEACAKGRGEGVRANMTDAAVTTTHATWGGG